MGKISSNRDRLDAVRDLALLGKPVDQCIEALSDFEWDFDGVPFVLSGMMVETILNRYLDGTLSSAELAEWANAIELRDDIDFGETDQSWIAEVIHTVASPELNGPISRRSVSDLLRQDRE